MSEPQGGEEPRVVIRDKRRIDPTSGEVRTPAGEQPAGAPPGGQHSTAPSPAQHSTAPSPAQHSTAPSPAPGEQMSEQQTPEATQAPARSDGDLASQLAERTEDLQRVSAEYANYRRRVDRDRSLVADQAAERFAAQLFPIVDDIQRARDHGDLTGAFKVVADRVLGLLEGLGATPFGTNGDPFDPSLHEAVMHDTSPDVDYSMVTTVLRQGYRRGDRVLRTAMVAVTDPEGPASAGEQGTSEGPGAPATD